MADKRDAVSLMLCIKVMFWLIRWDNDSEARGRVRSGLARVRDDSAGAGGSQGKMGPVGAASVHQDSSSAPESIGTTVSVGNQDGDSSFLRFDSSTAGDAASRLRLTSREWPSLRIARVLPTDVAGGRYPVCEGDRWL